MQHAIADIEPLSIDIPQMQARRDMMVEELREIGYTVHVPDGTYYLMPESPIKDDEAFCDILYDNDILALSGTVVGLPGFFRLSLTASDEMVRNSIAGFAGAFEQAKSL